MAVDRTEDAQSSSQTVPHDTSDVFVRLLASASLKELLKTATSLSSEVQLLEDEARTLIYDNYTEFVAAADLVTSAQGDLIGTSTDRAEQLRERIDGVLTGGTALYGRLKDYFQRYNVASRRKALFTALTTVFQLPKLMSCRINEKRYADAVDLYLAHHTFLQHYAPQSPAIQRVLVKSERLFISACAALKEHHALDARSTELLLKSGVDNAEELLGCWLRSCDVYVAEELKRHSQRQTRCSQLPSLTQSLSASLVPYILHVLEESQRLFQDLSDKKILTSALDGFVSRNVSKLCTSIAEKCNEEYDCDTACAAATELRAALVPLQTKADVVSLFGTFSHDLATRGICMRFTSTMKEYVTTSLIPLLTECHAADPTLDERRHGDRIDDPSQEALHKILESIVKSGQTLTVALGTAIADCEKIVATLFGSLPTPGRQKLAGVIDSGLLTTLRTLEAVADLLCDPNAPLVYAALPEVLSWARDLLCQHNQTYCHLSLTAISLLFSWLTTHATSKLKTLLDDLFPSNERPFTDTSRICRDTAGRLLAEVTNRWGRLIAHLLLDTASQRKTSEVLECQQTMTLSFGAQLAGREIQRAARLFQTMFLGAPAENFTAAQPKVRWDRHLDWCRGDHTNSVDVERLLARRHATVARSLPSLNWSAAMLGIARTTLRHVLEQRRCTRLDLVESQQAQLDLIWVRDMFWMCLESRDHGFEARLPLRFGQVPKRDLREDRQLFRLVDILVEDTMMLILPDESGVDSLLTSEQIRSALGVNT